MTTYNSNTSGIYTDFTNDEKVAYAINLSLSRITTDAFKGGYEWFNSPNLYDPTQPSSILSKKLLTYSEIKDYYLVVTINNIEYITNIQVGTFLTTSSGAGAKLSDIINTSNNKILLPTETDTASEIYNSGAPQVNDFNAEGLLTKLPRQCYAYFVYWKNKLTGKDGNNDGNSSSNSGSGTYPYSDNELSIKLTLNSNGDANGNRKYSTVIDNNNLMNKLKEYVPIKIIDNNLIPSTISQTTGIPEDLKKKIIKNWL